MYSFQMQFLSTVSIQFINYAVLGWLDFIKVVCKARRQSTFPHTLTSHSDHSMK